MGKFLTGLYVGLTAGAVLSTGGPAPLACIVLFAVCALLGGLLVLAEKR